MVCVGLLASSHLSAANIKHENEKAYFKPNPPTASEDVESSKKYDAEQKRLQALKKRSISYKTKGNACSCVAFAQSLGLKLSGYGLAKNYPAPGKIPASSGFVATYESRPGTNTGHLAFYILNGEYLILTEANYVGCRITSGRRLPVNSPLIRGYIN